MAKNQNEQAVSFAWNDASKKEPGVSKVGHHDLYKISTILLIHDEKLGVKPGYFLKYQKDHPGGFPPREKGEAVWHDMHGTELKNVLYFYPVDKMPVTKPPVVEEPGKEQQ